MNDFVPLILKPTATVLIDDDSFFINNVKSLLPKDTFASTICATKLNNCYEQSLLKISGDSLNSMKLKSFKSLDDLFIKEDELFVSTIVIDQCMYPKNGLEILSKINNTFIQKILISNFFSHEDAIQALNHGIINAYLCKMDRNFIEILTNTIYETQFRFFCNLSLTNPNFLSNDNPLIEKEILTIFKNIQEQYAMKYYESSKNLRKFFFSDYNKKNKVKLDIIPQEELEEVLQSQQAESAPSYVIELIRDGKMLPCFASNTIPDGNQWISYLKPAKIFEGKRKYIYSIYRDDIHESI